MDAIGAQFLAPSSKLALATLGKVVLMIAMGASMVSLSLRAAPSQLSASAAVQKFLNDYCFAPVGMLLISASFGLSAAVSQDCKSNIFFSQARFNTLFSSLYPVAAFAAASWIVIQFGLSAFLKLVAVPALFALPALLRPALFSSATADTTANSTTASVDPTEVRSQATRTGRASFPLYRLPAALAMQRATSPTPSRDASPAPASPRSTSPMIFRHTSVMPVRLMALDALTWSKRYGVVVTLMAVAVIVAIWCGDCTNAPMTVSGGGLVVSMGMLVCWLIPSKARAMAVAGAERRGRDSGEGEECTVFLYGKKLDLKGFIKKHPGGAKPLRIYNGRDATEVFEAYHSPEACAQAASMLKLFGKEMTAEERDAVRAPRDYDMVAAFSAFRKQLVKDGFFKVRWFEEGLKWAEFLAWWVSGMYFLRCDTFGLHLVGLGLYTIAIHQIGWASHDHCHHSTTNSPWFCDILAELAAGLQAYNRDWWKARHNAHHVATNELCNDPDIKTAPVFTYMAGMINVATGHNPLAERNWHPAAKEAAKSPSSPLALAVAASVPEKLTKAESSTIPGARDSLFIPRPPAPMSSFQLKQGKYFLPVMTLLHLYWMVESYVFVVIRLKKMWPKLLVLFASYALIAWTFAKAGVFMFIAFVLIRGLATALCVFATHYGEGRLPPTHTLSLVEHTALTTRNIKGGPFNFMHWFSGGISLQVEHHLFPTMPRTNLVRVQPLVKKFFKEHGIEFIESSFYGCLAHNIKQLDGVDLAHLATMS